MPKPARNEIENALVTALSGIGIELMVNTVFAADAEVDVRTQDLLARLKNTLSVNDTEVQIEKIPSYSNKIFKITLIPE